MAQQTAEGGSTGGQPTEEVTRRNPIDWENVERDTLGTHTFNADLYDAETFDERRPPYYRTGQKRDGSKCRYGSSYGDQVPPTAAVEDFINSANTPEYALREDNRTVKEEVAITPTEDELATYKDEYDDRSRHYEPHFLRVPFFSERIVGDAGLSAAYGLVIGNARNADNPDYEYEWVANYDTGEVTIMVT